MSSECPLKTEVDIGTTGDKGSINMLSGFPHWVLIPLSQPHCSWGKGTDPRQCPAGFCLVSSDHWVPSRLSCKTVTNPCICAMYTQGQRSNLTGHIISDDNISLLVYANWFYWCYVMTSSVTTRNGTTNIPGYRSKSMECTTASFDIVIYDHCCI